MKNTNKLKAILRIAGIIALMAIIGFSFAACGGDDDGGPLSGTKWYDATNDQTITFSSSQYTWEWIVTEKGTYTYSGSASAGSGVLHSTTSYDAQVNFTVSGSTLNMPRYGYNFTKR